MSDANSDVEEARRSFIRVGHDSVVGSLRRGDQRLDRLGERTGHLQQVSVLGLQQVLASGGDALLLDVRSPTEWKSGYIEGATHIPAGELPHQVQHSTEIGPVYIICGSGFRSSVASSFLVQSGRRQVINVIGGIKAWKNQRLAEVAHESGCNGNFVGEAS